MKIVLVKLTNDGVTEEKIDAKGLLAVRFKAGDAQYDITPIEGDNGIRIRDRGSISEPIAIIPEAANAVIIIKGG